MIFFEVPRIEELQDPDSSPRREEVGRRTLGDDGGFLLPFFCRARFRESTSTTVVLADLGGGVASRLLGALSGAIAAVRS